MTLTVRDAAKLLGIPERTVYRWIDRQNLPATRVGDQYHFNRAELLEWAMANRMQVSPTLFAEEGSGEPSGFYDCLLAGGVYYGISGEDKESVLADVVRIMPLPPEVDRPTLLQVLLARESLESTGLGNGIAIPHPRNPIVMHVPRPLVALCYLARPVEFHAIDGQPVHTLLAIVSPTVKAHLHLLSRISYALRDEEFAALMRRCATREEILAAARRVDGRATSNQP